MANILTNIRRASAPLQEQSSQIGLRVGKFISQTSTRIVEAAGGADLPIDDIAVAVGDDTPGPRSASADSPSPRKGTHQEYGEDGSVIKARHGSSSSSTTSTISITTPTTNGSSDEVAADSANTTAAATTDETSTATTAATTPPTASDFSASDSTADSNNTNSSTHSTGILAQPSSFNSTHGFSIHGGTSAASSVHGASAHGTVRQTSLHDMETGALMRSVPYSPSPSASAASVVSDPSPPGASARTGLPPTVPAVTARSPSPARGTTVLFFPGMGGETGSEKLVVCESRALPHLFTRLRDRKTPSHSFNFYAKRMMRILAEEGIACLESSRPFITTPTGATFSSVFVDESKVCIVSILRAGDALAEAAQACIPHAPVGKVLIQRNEESDDKHPVLYCKWLPPKIGTMQVLLCDPMLATGGSSKMAIRALLEAGVKESAIVFVTVLVCPEGMAALSAEFPEVTVVTGAVDDCLDERRYIVPGLGDFGDRFFGTVS